MQIVDSQVVNEEKKKRTHPLFPDMGVMLLCHFISQSEWA